MVVPLSLTLQNFSVPPERAKVRKAQTKDWNSLIKQRVQLKDDHGVLSLHTQMESSGISPDNETLPLVLKACARLEAVEHGSRIHSGIRGTERVQDVRIGTALVDFYCKCGNAKDARQVFDGMAERDLVCWNAFVSGCVACGEFEESILLARRLQREGFRPNSRTLVAMLSACEGAGEVRIGKAIHGYCLRLGFFDTDPYVGSSLIGFYLAYDVRIARLVFDLMGMKTTVIWNAMITGHFDAGGSFEAVKLFAAMLVDGVQFDTVTLLIAIQATGEFGSLELGNQFHQVAIKLNYKEDVFILNALLNMYRDIGSLESSSKVFNASARCDVAMWNSMLATYAEYSSYEEAARLLVRMQRQGIKLDKRTTVILLSLCTEITDGFGKGKSLHAYSIKSGMNVDVNLGNALLNLYASHNCVRYVRTVFGQMRSVEVVSYNTLISVLACNNLEQEALEVLELLVEAGIEPNSYTIIPFLAGCEDERSLNMGRTLHGFVIKHGIDVNSCLNTALSEMYLNCGDESTARNIFESSPNRDLISWNSLIAGYTKKNQVDDALLLFNRMLTEVEPNAVTIVSMLSACTEFAHLPQGRCLHAYVIRRQSILEFNLSLSNAFISMYARCGSLSNAEKIFKALRQRDIISWNAIIGGYGMHGYGVDAILALSRMQEDGFEPNTVTFVSALSACSHAGLTEEGSHLFKSMVEDYSISPQLAHYGCMVDLLGRAGLLDEAKEVIESMPVEPDASVWRALLSAYRNHKDPRNAAAIFEKLTELQPMNPGNYVLLSNTYAAAGLWGEVREVRKQLRQECLSKSPGVSWIVIRDQTHRFTAGDGSQLLTESVYACLASLSTTIKDVGYVPDICWEIHA